MNKITLADADNFMIEITGDPSTDFGWPGRRFAVCNPKLPPSDGWYVFARLTRGAAPTIRIIKQGDDGTRILVPMNKRFPATKLEDAEILAGVLNLSIQGR